MESKNFVSNSCYKIMLEIFSRALLQCKKDVFLTFSHLDFFTFGLFSHFDQFWGTFWTRFWAHCGPFLDNFFSHFRPILGTFGTIFGPFWADFEHFFGPILGTPRGQVWWRGQPRFYAQVSVVSAGGCWIERVGYW